MHSILRAVAVVLVFVPSYAIHAAHPLITEDTGTQGAGRYQLELTNEHGYDEYNGTDSYVVQSASVFSAGLTDRMDAIVSVPHLRYHIDEDGEHTSAAGWGDIGVSLKWRFYEEQNWSFAFKPGFSIAQGDAEQGLGSGEATYNAFFIATYASAPWAFHLHTGYTHNANTINQRRDLRHLSFAVAYDATEKLKVVGDLGIDTNSDATVHSDPGFLIAGLIYTIVPDIDLSVGYKAAVTDAHIDHAYLGGLTVRF